MKYIIVEDNAEALAHLYCRLIEMDTTKEIVLIKCNYNANVKEEEAEEKERKKIANIIKEKSRGGDKIPKIEVMKTAEDLLDSAVKNDLYLQDDILLMDISLFDSRDEENSNDYTEYASVQLAEKLLEMKKIQKVNVRFYSRATSKSDPEAFSVQTGGKWYVPILRPMNFYALGVDEEVEIFINKILRKERL